MSSLRGAREGENNGVRWEGGAAKVTDLILSSVIYRDLQYITRLLQYIKHQAYSDAQFSFDKVCKQHKHQYRKQKVSDSGISVFSSSPTASGNSHRSVTSSYIAVC
ncbi:hypothetical protein DPX16_19768 [Anabarilius grahami]|uniref:Uncharacterized protein n=1 Tax=Anabarilius grahami TaxID=495550 RepID=A0A3N0XQE9_ANAGA|nr:hypothetical protein DPX16_19768 [Anabarilius grahami]